MLSQTPQLPYYAVIFTSQLTNNDAGYAEAALEMIALAWQQPEFLGVDSATENIRVLFWSFQDMSLQALSSDTLHYPI